jgi:hypothetical protein
MNDVFVAARAEREIGDIVHEASRKMLEISGRRNRCRHPETSVTEKRVHAQTGWVRLSP